MLICSVFGEHLAAGGALEGLEARLAFNGEGGSVLCGTTVSNAILSGTIRVCRGVQISADSLPRPCHPLQRCAHAFAVLCESVSPAAFLCCRQSYFAPLPMVLVADGQSSSVVVFGESHSVFVDCGRMVTIFGGGVWKLMRKAVIVAKALVRSRRPSPGNA